MEIEADLEVREEMMIMISDLSVGTDTKVVYSVVQEEVNSVDLEVDSVVKDHEMNSAVQEVDSVVKEVNCVLKEVDSVVKEVDSVVKDQEVNQVEDNNSSNND